MPSSKLVSIWQRSARRQVRTLAKAGEQATRQWAKAVAAANAPPPGQGDWLPGMTLGPATGRLIAEMIAGEPTFVDATAFGVTRFSGI